MSIGTILPLVIIGEGAWLLCKMRAFYVLHPYKTLRTAFSGEGTGSAWLSLMLALAGTLGVGNILGVTVAIGAGGAGSLFWMVISSLFSSVIKYAEVRITAAHASKSGMVGVLKKSFTHVGGALSIFYAAAALILSLTMGAALQSTAIRDSAAACFDKRPTLLFAILAASVIPLALLRDGIKKAVAVIIPIATICYTGLCLFVILPNFSRIPEVASECIRDAFRPKSAAGGALGFLFSSAIARGFSAGLLSNEAGAGTSSFSHNALPESEAARAGVFGIIEVLFDTVLLCALTGLTIIIACDGSTDGYGIHALAKIFSRYVGTLGEPLLLAAVIAFALSTVLCWYYYGGVCVVTLTGGKHRRAASIFPPVFFTAFALGLLFDMPWLIPITDLLLFALTLLTLAAVIKNRRLLCKPTFISSAPRKHKKS